MECLFLLLLLLVFLLVRPPLSPILRKVPGSRGAGAREAQLLLLQSHSSRSLIASSFQPQAGFPPSKPSCWPSFPVWAGAQWGAIGAATRQRIQTAP